MAGEKNKPLTDEEMLAKVAEMQKQLADATAENELLNEENAKLKSNSKASIGKDKKLSAKELAERAFKEVPYATSVFVNEESQQYHIHGDEESLGDGWEEATRDKSSDEKKAAAEWAKNKNNRVNAAKQVKSAQSFNS